MSNNGGFTLLELLVVVLIIGLISAITVLSVGVTGQDTDLEREGERAFALIRYAREKAELQTREFGLYCGAQGYEFLTYDPRRSYWRSVDEDESLRLRDLPDGLSLRLVVEGREVVLRTPDTRGKSEEQLEQEARERVPHIILFSNGDMTPFRLTVERPESSRSITIASTEEGTIEEGDLVDART